MKKTISIIMLCVLSAMFFYSYRFYPKQLISAESISQMKVLTPQPDFYHNKAAQLKIGKHIFYLPKPHHFDLWHFDLVEYGGKLMMVASEEKNDVLMLAQSDDWYNFKPLQTPLINNHYMENYCHYRQYYYKPTAIIENDTLKLFYTSNSLTDPNQNVLFMGLLPLKK